MATFNIYRIRIGSVGDVDYPTGSIVYVKWNDSTNNFQVDVHDSGDTYVSTETSGPDLTVDDYIDIDYGFTFCQSSTLVSFTKQYDVFPYANRVDTLNSAQCATRHLCDVLVTDITTTNATTETAADGQAVAVVSGADSPFYYSLDNFVTQQTSATFTGLIAGNYRMYAKSIAYPTCISSKAFTIGFDTTYGVRYRGEFDSPLKELEGYSYRVDILERGFTDPVTEVKTGDRPFVLRYQGETEDKYKPVIASMAEIELISESDFYFIDLFTGDERQFLVKFYVNDGGGFDLEWTGYLLQQGYEEDYKAAPYLVKLIATDGLADLSQVDYSDVGSKSLLTILSGLIRQTDLNLPIRSAVNIFETNHNTAASDDPLPQTYTNTYFIKNKKGLEVIEDILKPFGARLFQSLGYWWILRIEDSVSASLAYREYTAAGVYSSNSTISLRNDIDFPTISNRLCWSGNPLMRIRAGYKDVTVTHNLGLENNLFYEGRMHEDDFNTDTGLFNGIGIELGSAGTGVTYGLQYVNNGDSKHALYVDFQNAEGAAGVVVFTEDKTIESDNFRDRFLFKFDYLVYTLRPANFVRFAWMVDLSSGYVLRPNTVHTDYNPFYVEASSFYKWNKFEYQFGPIDSTSMQVRLSLLANNTYDASNLTGFKTLDTDGLDVGEKRISLDTISGTDYLREYVLNFTTSTEISPEILEPSDYATSKKRWILDQTRPFFTLGPTVAYILIDNLRVEFFPDGDNPAETETYNKVINSNNKQPYEVEVTLGDLPDTRNAKYIYKNHFSLSDGTPTEFWSRDTVTESKNILEILAEDFANQNDIGIRLLSGQLTGDKVHRFHNCLVDKFDGDRKFINMGLEVDYRNNLYNAEIIEVITGDDGNPPAVYDSFNDDFNNDFS